MEKVHQPPVGVVAQHYEGAWPQLLDAAHDHPDDVREIPAHKSDENEYLLLAHPLALGVEVGLLDHAEEQFRRCGVI